MRRFVAPLLALTLGACVMPTGISIGPGKGHAHGRTTVVASTLAAVSIHQALNDVRKEVERLRAKLRPVSCGAARCYAAADVDEVVAIIRQRVDGAFPEEALPLRMAVAAEIDRVTALSAPSTPVFKHVRMPPDPSTRSYGAQETDSMFRQVLQYLDSIGKYESYTPSLEFRSAPEAASYEIQIANTTITRRSGRTNELVPEIWRGVYTGKATKAGYRDASIKIDLMNDQPRAVCQCTLYKTTAPPGDESYCKVHW